MMMFFDVMLAVVIAVWLLDREDRRPRQGLTLLRGDAGQREEEDEETRTRRRLCEIFTPGARVLVRRSRPDR